MKEETEKTKQYFRNQLQKKFNEKKFDRDIQLGKEISKENLNEYEKEEEDEFLEFPDDENGVKLSFRANFKNGEYRAIGSNGHQIKSKNIDDFHRQLAKVFKIHGLRKGKEPQCRFHVGENVVNKEKWVESFARNFINAGVVVKGDLPRSPEFWSKMKTDYLAKEGHNLTSWNRLTRFVPPEHMGIRKRTKTSGTQQRTALAFVNKGMQSR